MSGNLRRELAPAPPTALDQVLKRRSIAPGPRFAPLPEPRGPAPYRRSLAEVLGPDRMAEIEADRALRFHCVGDTGGWRDGLPQSLVSAAMVADLGAAQPVHFFYHLGDVVYPHGEEANYGPQFFSAYRAYDAPIFAIPGNHDGEAPSDGRASSLEPFVRAFCSPSAPLHDAAVHLPRPPVHQPHVHWTLVHDWLRIVGLYANVPEDGELAADQLDWLTGELRAAPDDVVLILAVHRPVYSVDVVHGSNLDLGDALDRCCARAGRWPEAVLSGHAHNYQRFSRRVQGRVIPYVVAGSGGFHQRHGVGSGLPPTPARFPGLPGVTLDAWQCSAHGYLTVTVTPREARIVHRTVSEEGTRVFDAFPLARPGR